MRFQKFQTLLRTLFLASSVVPLALGGCYPRIPPVAPEAASITPDIQARVADARARRRDHYANLLERFLLDTPTQKPGGTVFVGDSITEGFPLADAFPKRHVINRGIGGDLVEGVIERLDVSVADLKPAQVYVMIGINDLWWGEPVSMEVRKERYVRLLQGLKQAAPKAKTFIQSILPVGGNMPELNACVVEVNNMLRGLTEEAGLTYVDLHPWLGDETGALRPEFTTDGVHLTLGGYEAWLQAILPADEFLEAAVALCGRRAQFHSAQHLVNAVDPAGQGEYPGNRGPDQLIVYTPAYGQPTTGTNQWGLEAIVKQGKVVKQLSGGNAEIPSDGFVVSGHGEASTWIAYNLKPGVKVEREGTELHLLPLPENQMTAVQRVEALRVATIDAAKALMERKASRRSIRQASALLEDISKIRRELQTPDPKILRELTGRVRELQSKAGIQ